MMLSKTATTLSDSFTPGENHIIIGRGRLVKSHIANRKFDKMIARVAQEYSAAPCKAEKGLILTRLINVIHDQSPDAGFVRKDPVTGKWSLVEESLARQTAAQAIRNHLHHDYRSSKQFKSKRRLQQIQEQQQQQEQQQPTAAAAAVVNKASATALPVPSVVTIARCVSPTDCLHEKNMSNMDTLSLLFSAFAPNNIDVADNPFEPRPLAPSVETVNMEPIALAV